MSELTINIKIKRILLIVFLVVISFVCFTIMNNKYDRLARYEYADETNRDIIEENLTDEEIDFLIQQKITPDQFLTYIYVEGFNVKNTLYYEACNEIQPIDLESIVDFCNTYRDLMTYKEFVDYITYYDYTLLLEFFNGAYTYVQDVTLISNPTQYYYEIEEDETLYKYEPMDLVEITNAIMPSVSSIEGESVKVHADMVEQLTLMLAAMEEEFQQTAGGLIATLGYVSYENQITLYESALVTYGADEFLRYEDHPGQNPRQYGYMLTFTIAGLEEEDILENEQVIWLSQHVQEYGFIIAYTDKESIDSNKEGQPLTICFINEIVDPVTIDIEDNVEDEETLEEDGNSDLNSDEVEGNE